jgi:hypothetical protein
MVDASNHRTLYRNFGSVPEKATAQSTLIVSNLEKNEGGRVTMAGAHSLTIRFL